MEILLEMDEYKRTINISQEAISSNLLLRVADEMKKLANLGEASVSLAGESGDFFLQMWSNKWNTFVDVKDVKDIGDGDRLKIVKRSSPAEVKS